MIFGNLNDLSLLKTYPKIIQKAILYLKETNLKEIKPGTYEIMRKDMFMQVIDLETESREKKRAEVHRKYIDLQCLVVGKEKIGFAIDCEENIIAEEYNSERDILFYENCQNEGTLKMIEGSFAVFYPNVVHIPGCIDKEKTKIRKIVVKIDMKLL